MDKVKAPEFEIMFDDKVPIIYANHAQFYVSNWDFSFDLGTLLPQVKASKPKIKIDARIIMSPAHAKQFALMLMDNVTKYEKTFGKINVAPKPKK